MYFGGFMSSNDGGNGDEEEELYRRRTHGMVGRRNGSNDHGNNRVDTSGIGGGGGGRDGYGFEENNGYRSDVRYGEEDGLEAAAERGSSCPPREGPHRGRRGPDLLLLRNGLSSKPREETQSAAVTATAAAQSGGGAAQRKIGKGLCSPSSDPHGASTSSASASSASSTTTRCWTMWTVLLTAFITACRLKCSSLSIRSMMAILSGIVAIVSAGCVLAVTLAFSLQGARDLAQTTAQSMVDRTSDNVYAFLRAPEQAADAMQFAAYSQVPSAPATVLPSDRRFYNHSFYNLSIEGRAILDSPDSWHAQWWDQTIAFTRANRFRFQFAVVGFSDGNYAGCKTLPENDATFQCRAFTYGDRVQNTTNVSTVHDAIFYRSNYTTVSRRDGTVRTGYDPRTRSWYGLVDRTPFAKQWSPVYLSAIPTLPILDVNAALFNRSGTFLGVASITYEIGEIDNELKRVRPTLNTEIVLLGNNRLVLASTLRNRRSYTTSVVNGSYRLLPSEEASGCAKSDVRNDATTALKICLFSIEEFGYQPLLAMNRSYMSDLEAGFSEPRMLALAGSNYFVVVLALATPNVAGMNWRVALFMPEDEVIGEIVRGRNIAIGISVGVVLIVVIGTAFLVRLLLEPLSIIADRMHRAAYFRVRGGMGIDGDGGNNNGEDEDEDVLSFGDSDDHHQLCSSSESDHHHHHHAAGGAAETPDQEEMAPKHSPLGDGFVGSKKRNEKSGSQHNKNNKKKKNKKKNAAQLADEALMTERRPSYLSEVASIQSAYWLMADEMWLLKGYVPHYVREEILQNRDFHRFGSANSSVGGGGGGGGPSSLRAGEQRTGKASSAKAGAASAATGPDAVLPYSEPTSNPSSPADPSHRDRDITTLAYPRCREPTSPPVSTKNNNTHVMGGEEPLGGHHHHHHRLHAGLSTEPVDGDGDGDGGDDAVFPTSPPRDQGRGTGGRADGNREPTAAAKCDNGRVISVVAAAAPIMPPAKKRNSGSSSGVSGGSGVVSTTNSQQQQEQQPREVDGNALEGGSDATEDGGMLEHDETCGIRNGDHGGGSGSGVVVMVRNACGHTHAIHVDEMDRHDRPVIDTPPMSMVDDSGPACTAGAGAAKARLKKAPNTAAAHTQMNTNNNNTNTNVSSVADSAEASDYPGLVLSPSDENSLFDGSPSQRGGGGGGRGAHHQYGKGRGGIDPLAVNPRSTAAPSAPLYFRDRSLIDREITMVVINIVDFHSYVLHATRRDVQAISREFPEFIKLVERHCKMFHGVLETFSGDKFIVSFNATALCPDHVQHAVAFACTLSTFATRVAIERQKYEQEAVSLRQQQQTGANTAPPNPPDRSRHQESHVFKMSRRLRVVARGISCGVATGKCIVGPLGSDSVKRHTIISNALVEAAALERLCMRYPGCRVLVGGDVIPHISRDFEYLLLDAMALPGSGGKRRHVASVKYQKSQQQKDELQLATDAYRVFVRRRQKRHERQQNGDRNQSAISAAIASAAVAAAEENASSSPTTGSSNSSTPTVTTPHSTNAGASSSSASGPSSSSPPPPHRNNAPATTTQVSSSIYHETTESLREVTFACTFVESSGSGSGDGGAGQLPTLHPRAMVILKDPYGFLNRCLIDFLEGRPRPEQLMLLQKLIDKAQDDQAQHQQDRLDRACGRRRQQNSSSSGGGEGGGRLGAAGAAVMVDSTDTSSATADTRSSNIEFHVFCYGGPATATMLSEEQCADILLMGPYIYQLSVNGTDGSTYMSHLGEAFKRQPHLLTLLPLTPAASMVSSVVSSSSSVPQHAPQ